MRYLNMAVVGTCAVVATAVVMAQPGAGKRSPGAQLREWNGEQATVYLRLDSDPRSGRSTFSGSTLGGISYIEQIPISVRGTIASIADDAITVSTEGSTVWIPRDRIHAIVNGSK